jgi:hypothetical protein
MQVRVTLCRGVKLPAVQRVDAARGDCRPVTAILALLDQAGGPRPGVSRSKLTTFPGRTCSQPGMLMLTAVRGFSCSAAGSPATYTWALGKLSYGTTRVISTGPVLVSASRRSSSAFAASALS